MKTDARAVAAQSALKATGAAAVGLTSSDIADGVKNNRATIVGFGTKMKF
jgi:hypothetical protein